MSLRGFHFVFITAAILLALGFAFLEFSAYRQGQAAIDLGGACIAALIGALLVGYEVWFFKKSVNLKS